LSQLQNFHFRTFISFQKVQDNALKLVTDLNRMTYTERCKEAGLETVESWRAYQDLLQMFKILKGIDNVKKEDFFKGMGRGHRTKQASNSSNMVRRGGETEATQLHMDSGGEMEQSAGLSKLQRG
jgi:urate oxidase